MGGSGAALAGPGRALGGSIYTKTPDQPPQRTLCYAYTFDLHVNHIVSIHGRIHETCERRKDKTSHNAQPRHTPLNCLDRHVKHSMETNKILDLSHKSSQFAKWKPIHYQSSSFIIPQTAPNNCTTCSKYKLLGLHHGEPTSPTGNSRLLKHV